MAKRCRGEHAITGVTQRVRGGSDTDHTWDNDRLDGGTDGDTVRGGGGSDTMLDDSSELDENFAYWAEWVDAV